MQLRRLDDTRALARALADRLPPGSLLVLSGGLGAGKTTLTRFLAEALASDANVSSPTYTLVHEYPTPQGPLVHIDAYRLGDATNLAGLGLDEMLERARLVVVEWGDALLDLYPEAYRLRIERDGETRRAELFDARGEGVVIRV